MKEQIVVSFNKDFLLVIESVTGFFIFSLLKVKDLECFKVFVFGVDKQHNFCACKRIVAEKSFALLNVRNEIIELRICAKILLELDLSDEENSCVRKKPNLK